MQVPRHRGRRGKTAGSENCRRRGKKAQREESSPPDDRGSNPEPSGDRQEGTSGGGSGFDDGEEAEAKHRFESHKSNRVQTEAIEVYAEAVRSIREAK